MRRFWALRFVAVLYRIFAWVVLLAGLAYGLFVIVTGINGVRIAIPGIAPTVTGFTAGLVVGLLSILGTALYFVMVYAISDLIYMGLAIEENTRDMAVFLRGDAPPPPPPPPADV